MKSKLRKNWQREQSRKEMEKEKIRLLKDHERMKQSTKEGEKRYIIGKMIKGDDILNRTHGKDKCLKDGFSRKVTEE